MIKMQNIAKQEKIRTFADSVSKNHSTIKSHAWLWLSFIHNTILHTQVALIFLLPRWVKFK